MKIFNWKLILQFYATVGIPLLYLINLFIINRFQNTFNLFPLLSVIGIVIALLGIFSWSLSYIYLGKSFNVLPKKTKRVKKGLYKYLKHPMYFSIWLTFLGLSLANNSLHGLIFLNLILVPILIVRAKLEEKYLID